ncbi:MAG: tetratricopeptide repeat protein, partial [Pirellulales bacterium]
ELLRAGCSPRTIERKMVELAELLPHVGRPLAELSVIVEGKQLLVRQENGLAEPGGQLRLDFSAVAPEFSGTEPADAPDQRLATSVARGPSQGDLTGPAEDAAGSDPPPPDELVSLAFERESQGELDQAAEMMRAALAAAGPDPEINFLLADLLYRMGELSAARERYFMAIELDENYVEARTNLGCVLAEMGEFELAKSAFLGALAFHDYPDAHYHLARTLDVLEQHQQAEGQWRAFLDKVPDSPWADEARHRLRLEPQ